MEQRLIDRYDLPVPRYTSYPTAPHFHEGVNADVYSAWLALYPPATPLSLYVHIPFCRSLCWFCGCHTRVVNRPEPVEAYLATLLNEIALVAAKLGPGRLVRHIHFGGGTPTILSADQIRLVMEVFRRHFVISPDAEIAVEIDPRSLTEDRIDTLGSCGFTRASLGVQDVDEQVQRAVNRLQPMETVLRAGEWLRKAGIAGLNVDLMYGLPHQTVEHVRASVDAVADMQPDRLALFGYAHVPHMKTHQNLILEAALPGSVERFAQFEAASKRLVDLGYAPIGLDHFARARDPLAKGAANGTLRRNFQGYTVDPAGLLLGFGASAIGAGTRGYVQNETDVRLYKQRIDLGQLAVKRGVMLNSDDRLRADLIERLMCSLQVNVAEICAQHGRSPESLGIDFDRLDAMEADGLVRVEGWNWSVPEEMRAFLRLPCSLFDAYLGQGAARHARAV